MGDGEAMDEDRIINFSGLRMSRDTWHNFRWDVAAASVFSLFNVVFNQFYIPIALRHGASDFEVGLLAAAPAVGLLFSPAWAGLMEGRSPKPFFLLPNLIGRLLLIIPALYSTPVMFVLTAFLFHLLMGIQAPAYAALMTRLYPADQRGRLMGNVRVIMGLLMLPLAWVTGLWIDASGSSGPLLVAAVTGALSLIAFQQVREVPRFFAGGKGEALRLSLFGQLRLLRGNRPVLIFLAATSLAGFGNMLASPLYAIYQVNELGLSNAQIGYLRMAYFACMLLAYLIAGWAIDRFSPQAVMACGLTAMTTVPFLYGLVGTFPAVLAASGIQGISDAVWDIGCMAFVFHFARGREAVVFGLHLMLFGIRGTAGPLIGTSLNGAMPFGGMMLFVGALGLAGLLLFLGSRIRSEDGVTAEE
ncbi:MFS transporter [Paenibacillus mucilaginosus]|uniref:Major facilitator superfamily MFS_1 n=2 Tax=Paenibacillus mucilaginosus TaxID=61624 RepID=F8F8V8_PAEMK|nr:major facilitator superfamily MFS_1 [Paenibacillus mucilaginosus KNP414]WDM28913.1 MFS transporter [Paenibacillus mucilaginosus]